MTSAYIKVKIRMNGQPAPYSLSAPTKKEFEQWLGESEE